MFLAQGQDTVPSARLEPATPQSQLSTLPLSHSFPQQQMTKQLMLVANGSESDSLTHYVWTALSSHVRF